MKKCKEFIRKRSKFIQAVVALIVMILSFCSCLGFPTFTKHAANAIARGAFYVPSGGSPPIIDEWSLLRTGFFGREYNDTTERIIVLHENEQAPKKSDGSSENSPEDGITAKKESIPDDMLPIINCDLGTNDIHTLNNTTSKRPNTYELVSSKYDFGYSKNDSEPLVLIIHTHATECYSREGSTYYDPLSTTRSTDESINMISVGKMFADTLTNAGISTLHCTVQHDAESYNDSYSLAANSIREYLQNYPSIRYVLDIHRDAVIYESGAKARPTTEIDGAYAAQSMILVGSDSGGADFPNWEENLTLALKLADNISSKYPNLLRPIALRGASYNEQYTSGSLLIEIGTDGNTLSQAQYSAKLIAESLAELIKNGK